MAKRATGKSGKIKRSASENLAARRKAHAFRHGPTMSAQDYTYVQRDLIRIAILSVLMVTGIVVLYLLFGR